MNKGWIKLYRSIIDSWIWNEERVFSKAEAWIDILLMVNHEDKKLLCNGELFVVPAGGKLISFDALSKRWNWSRGKVKRFIELLENDRMITVKRTANSNLITVDNWAFYQSRQQETDSKQTADEQQTDSKRTADGQRTDTNKNIKNNIKNVENEKKKDICAFFESIWTLYPNKKGKSSVRDKQKEKLYAIGFDEMKRAIERYSAENVNTNMQYWKYGSTFFNSGYIDYLDENYTPRPVKDHKQAPVSFMDALREMEGEANDQRGNSSDIIDI